MVVQNSTVYAYILYIHDIPNFFFFLFVCDISRLHHSSTSFFKFLQISKKFSHMFILKPHIQIDLCSSGVLFKGQL